MSSYSLLYSKQADKYLLRLTRVKAGKILNRMESIAQDPLKPDNNITKLTGTKSSFRLRIGDIRIIYFLDISNKSIYIIKVAPRGSVYSM